MKYMIRNIQKLEIVYNDYALDGYATLPVHVVIVNNEPMFVAFEGEMPSIVNDVEINPSDWEAENCSYEWLEFMQNGKGKENVKVFIIDSQKNEYEEIFNEIMIDIKSGVASLLPRDFL